MWGLIIEKDDIEVDYQWFRNCDFATAFATNKLTQALEMDTQIIRVNEEDVAERQNFLRAKVIQWRLGNPLSNV